jgi:hypothetical protein
MSHGGIYKKNYEKKIQSCELNNKLPHLTDWIPLPVFMMILKTTTDYT